MALCSTAHTRVGTDTTVSNSGTTALSQTSLEATRLLMRDYVDETDNLITARGDTLLVPPDLEETAWEIVNAQGKVGTADNDPNFSKGKYRIIVWDYLNDSNNWFLIDSRFAKMYLKWFDRIPVEFNKDKDFDTLNVGSFVGNYEKQTDEIAGNSCEWTISSQAMEVEGSETIISAPVKDEGIVRSTQ